MESVTKDRVDFSCLENLRSFESLVLRLGDLIGKQIIMELNLTIGVEELSPTFPEKSLLQLLDVDRGVLLENLGVIDIKAILEHLIDNDRACVFPLHLSSLVEVLFLVRQHHSVHPKKSRASCERSLVVGLLVQGVSLVQEVTSLVYFQTSSEFELLFFSWARSLFLRAFRLFFLCFVRIFVFFAILQRAFSLFLLWICFLGLWKLLG